MHRADKPVKRALAKHISARHLARMAAKKRVRKREDYQHIRVVSRAPRANGATVWDLERIRAARDAQISGVFREPVRLAEAMRSDDAIFVARSNRLGPALSVQAALTAAPGTRGQHIADAAANDVICTRGTVASLHATLVDHGVAIGLVRTDANSVGTRVASVLEEWPLEHVRYDATTERLMTHVLGGPPVPIVHGDGQWIVVRRFDAKPWAQDACLLPAALLWAAHANGLKDWAQASLSHGMARVLGELPEGVPLRDELGAIHPTADAFLSMLQDVVSGDAAAGIRPSGSKADFLANGSTAWQVFSELIVSREKAAARIYCGTDAALGAQGGAPGVDIAALFGVLSTRIQSDLDTIAQALNVGVYQPWTAINFGSTRLAPSVSFALPDPDEDAKSAETAARVDRLLKIISALRTEQMLVDQDVIASLARALHVQNDAIPELAAQESARVPLDLAPTDVARVVRVREARASRGLPPVGDNRDELFISQLEAEAEAAAETPGVGAAEPTAP